jgi:hypothetical protein
MLQRRFRGVPGPALIGMSSSLSKPAQFGARRAGVLLASGLLLSLLQGCGGKTANRTPSNPGPAGPSEDAAVRDGGVVPDASVSWSPICPASQPTEGSPCNVQDVDCEYGDNFVPGCNVVLECSQGVWAGAIVNGGGACDAGANPAACPSSYSDVPNGAACDDPDDTCLYPTSGVCQCNYPADPEPDAGPFWFCGPGPGCPMPRPRLGSACAMPGLDCEYESCGVAQDCQNGVWQFNMDTCGG